MAKKLHEVRMSAQLVTSKDGETKVVVNLMVADISIAFAMSRNNVGPGEGELDQAGVLAFVND
jgi:hypothetical protein